jgi:HD superfamily phosphodiesterase
LGVSLVDDEDVSQGHNAEQGRSHDDHQIEGKDIDQRWDELIDDQRWDELIDTAVSTAFEDRSHDERLGQIEEKVDKYMKREQKVDKYIELEQKVDNLTKMLEYLVSAQQDRR